MDSTEGLPERPYTEADLEGKRRVDLIALVYRQRDKWIYIDKRHQPMRSKRDLLKRELLDPDRGFTTWRPEDQRDNSKKGSSLATGNAVADGGLNPRDSSPATVSVETVPNEVPRMVPSTGPQLGTSSTTILATSAGQEETDSVRTSVSPRKAPSTSVPSRVSDTTKTVIEELVRTVADDPGFIEFRSRRGVRSFTDTVKMWRFAVQFVHRFSGRYLPVPGMGNVKMNKNIVYGALGVGRTWMSDANKAMRIIDVYSGHSAHGVAFKAMLERVDNEARGAGHLLRDLEEWAQSHDL
ncbi:hypothetical protein PLICRDRAFT_38191 [Plicaturopsis crispa FD-325 SS-3]|nr:hypothetical protein PLICRDRAFT_38191 [Plicaturopsis crispa FD-325 SS-3]